ncbi:hypothetical protein [Streptomyces buecherae]|uniref:hypothetical protein n=1 Tax=Streptomyces buecherae TaxID=2763006 RepID=UPI0037B5527C
MATSLLAPPPPSGQVLKPRTALIRLLVITLGRLLSALTVPAGATVTQAVTVARAVLPRNTRQQPSLFLRTRTRAPKAPPLRSRSRERRGQREIGSLDTAKLDQLTADFEGDDKGIQDPLHAIDEFT